MRRVAVTALFLSALVGIPTSASAMWTASASGAVTVPASTLAAPANTTLTWDPTVRIGWTASTSSWATGYRVLRGVTTGALTQIGSDQSATARTLDDSPGAGTHYYAVVAYRNGWTSAPTAVRARADRDYMLTGLAPASGTGGCATAASITGMQQGHVPSGTGVSAVLAATTFTVCSEPWTTGQSLPGGSTTMTAHVSNTTPNKECSVGLTLMGGTTTLGTATVTIPAGQSAAAAMTWSVPTTAHAFTTGQRLSVTLAPGGGVGCDKTSFYAASSTYPSKVTLTA